MKKYDIHSGDKTVQELEQLLREEIQKDTPEEEKVLGMLDDLAGLEDGNPDEISEQAQDAWEHYKNNIAESSKSKKKPYYTWLIRCAAVIAVVCVLLIAVPNAVEADGVLGKMVRWAERVFETFTPFSPENEYVFRTEHSGLQELYNTVIAEGVTQSVVPMWLPEDLKMGAIKTSKSPAKSRIQARFENESQWVSYVIDVYDTEKESNYAKDSAQFQEKEVAGITHYILSNDESWSAVWIVDNIECTIATNYNEDILYEVVCSIYNMEGK